MYTTESLTLREEFHNIQPGDVYLYQNPDTTYTDEEDNVYYMDTYIIFLERITYSYTDNITFQILIYDTEVGWDSMNLDIIQWKDNYYPEYLAKCSAEKTLEVKALAKEYLQKTIQSMQRKLWQLSDGI